MVGGTILTWPRVRGLLLVAAVVVIVGSAVASVSLMLAWRGDQRATHVRLDVLGRERNLVTWVLADTERVIEDDDAAVEAIGAHLQLLRESWLVARDGGAESGLDLRPTGRQVVGWAALGTEHRSVEVALFSYANLVERFIADGRDHRSDLPELRTSAKSVVAQLDHVMRAAGDEAVDDKRFIGSVSALLFAVVLLIGLVVAFVRRARRRVTVQQAQANAVRASEARYRAFVTGLPLPVVIQGAAGILVANDAAAKLLGVSSPEDLTGVHFEPLLTSDRDGPVDRVSSSAARTGVADQYRVDVHLNSEQRTLQIHRRVIELEGEFVSVLVAIDLTAQLAAEADLAAAADLHRFLADNASERLIRASPDGQILYASQASGCTLQLDSLELVGANVVDITHPDDRILVQGALDRAIATGKSVDVDVRVGATAGHFAWVKLSAHRDNPSDGDLELHLAMRDISERRAAELALADTEATQRLILESLNEGVVFHSIEGGVVQANRAATEMLGVVAHRGTLSDQIIRSIRTYEPDGTPMDPADSPALRTLRSGHAERNRILQCRYRDGSVRWMQIDTVAVNRTADGSEQLVLETFIDVTTTKQAELALADAELVQRLILDRLDEGVVLHGLDVGIIRANRAATDMFGVVAGPDQFPTQLQKSVRSFEVDGTQLDPDDTPTRRALRSGQPAKGRILEYRSVDGTARWMQVDAYPMTTQIGGSVAPVLLRILDITARHAAATQLAASEKRLRLVIENSRELIAIVDLAGILRFVSPSALEILGHHPDAANGANIRDYIHPEDFDHVINHVMGNTHGRQSVRVRATTTDGSTRYLETLSQVITDEHGEADSVLLSSRDITERLEIERRLESEQRLLHATFESVHAGVLAINCHGRIIEANTAFCHLIGAQAEPGNEVFELNRFYTVSGPDGEELDPFDRPLAAALSGRTVIDIPLQLVRADGSCIQILASASPIAAIDEIGGVDGAVLTIHDVTALRGAEAELRRLAAVDALTGLPNRRAVVEHLAGALGRQRRTPENLAVLFLDLDGFKAINDSLGHEAGDDLLAAAGLRISSLIRPGDLIGRYGGDEFVIIVEELRSDDEVQNLADRLECALSEPFALTAGTVHIGGSVGIARLTPDSTLDTVLAAADAAMYERKRRSKLTGHRA